MPACDRSRSPLLSCTRYIGRTAGWKSFVARAERSLSRAAIDCSRVSIFAIAACCRFTR